MKPLFLALLALVVSLQCGCKSAGDYERNNSDTAAWLQAHAGRPGINVAGHWDSEDWGEGHFKQVGNKVTGILGDYPIGGVLNGDSLFLAITENGWTSYTAILRPSVQPQTFVGNYSYKVPFSTDDQKPMMLTRAPQ
ncbi:MAG TPA: hypothetical protein VNB29_04435 [Chthoniobacterales bacterium]|jgi:hypothetical protein|nr:hypothetical protein [Chthoniobacterales bacterium]